MNQDAYGQQAQPPPFNPVFHPGPSYSPPLSGRYSPSPPVYSDPNYLDHPSYLITPDSNRGRAHHTHFFGSTKEMQRVAPRRSRASICKRVCCGVVCLLIIFIIVVVIYFAAIFKIPNVAFNGAVAPTNREPLSIVQGGTVIQLNWDFRFDISNPNTLAIQLSSLDLKGYPSTVTDLNFVNQIANGTLANVNFPAHADTNVLYPVTFEWNTAQPSDTQFFLELLSSCGVPISNTPTQDRISVQYQLDIGLAVLKPFNYKYPHRDSQSFACPVNLGGNSLLTQLSDLINTIAPGAIAATPPS